MQDLSKNHLTEIQIRLDQGCGNIRGAIQGTQTQALAPSHNVSLLAYALAPLRETHD